MTKMSEKTKKEFITNVIDSCIEKIPKEQIKILKLIWDFFLIHKKWPNGRRFRKEQGILNLERIVSNLSPIFIWHIKNSQQEDYYRLTTEGVYAIEGFKGPNFSLIILYLDYLAKKFDENPEFKKVTSQEFSGNLSIESEKIRILGEFLDMGNVSLWGNSTSNLCSSNWEAGVINDIETLYELNDTKDFLFKHWHKNIHWIVRNKPNEIPDILRVNMKAKDKPKYISELREIILKFDVEQLVIDSDQALISQGICRAKAIFINFDYGMGEQLQALIDRLSNFDRSGDPDELKLHANNILNFIIQKTEEIDIYEILNTENKQQNSLIGKESPSDKIFIVHGHNEAVKESVARFLEKIGLEAIILHEQPNKGRTIIEKFEDYSDVPFAVVLLTADDRGGQFSELYEKQKPRARQNVIFELGYFIGKIGRNNVCAIYEESVEIPSDYQGILFIKMDKEGKWKYSLAKEIRAAGVQFNADNILK